MVGWRKTGCYGLGRSKLLSERISGRAVLTFTEELAKLDQASCVDMKELPG
jgi:hypothetical protein